MSAFGAAAAAYRPKWRSPVIPWGQCDAARRRDLRDAWSSGDITHHLTPSQYDTYLKFRGWHKSAWDERVRIESEQTGEKAVLGREFLMDSSRRWGKSALGSTALTEDALRLERARLVYIGPELKQIKRFVIPLMDMILSDCPPDLRPRFLRTDLVYEFPSTKSRIELIGLDKNPDGARGNAVDGVFCDEAAFFKNLEYLLNSVIKPQMLGRLWAYVLCASTPPVSPSHVWTTDMIPNAIKRGAHDLKTIEDADQYSLEEIEEIIAESGGRDSSTCQRELFCRHVADASMAIVPEYADVENEIVCEVHPPEWRDCYTSMDPGWSDLTGVLFGYWHFEQAQLVVEDELAQSRLTSGKIAEQIKLKEADLWTGVKRIRSNGEIGAQPYRRYSDRDGRLLNDLSREHDLVFMPTLKDHPEQATNQLRVAIQNKRILIHPRCEMLRMHLRNGVWKNDRKAAFAWHGGTMGHFDLISALIYMWRNINRKRNPSPVVTATFRSEAYDHGLAHAAKKVSKWDRRGRLTMR